MDLESIMAQARQMQRRAVLNRLVAEGFDQDLSDRLFAIMAHSENPNVFTEEAFEDNTVLRDGFTVGDLRVIETSFTALVNDLMEKTCQGMQAAEDRGIPYQAVVNFGMMNERVAVLLKGWDAIHSLVAEVPDEVPENWL